LTLLGAAAGALLFSGPHAWARPLTGVVFDSQQRPAPGAVVCVQAIGVCTETAADGRFRLEAPDKTASGLLTAWRPGYFNSGVAIQAGCDEYLIKPIDRRKLVEKIEALFRDPLIPEARIIQTKE